MTITVELDVFSGRPNPTWVLDDEAAARVLEILRDDLVPTESKLGGKLGYRGFVLESPDAPDIRIYAGVASFGDARHVFAPGVEAILLDAAIRVGHHALLRG